MLSLKKKLNYFLYKNHCVTIQRIVQSPSKRICKPFMNDEGHYKIRLQGRTLLTAEAEKCSTSVTLLLCVCMHIGVCVHTPMYIYFL